MRYEQTKKITNYFLYKDENVLSQHDLEEKNQFDERL